MGKAIFITGTGTDTGKTYVTGLILKKLHEGGCSAAYYKAAMSGNVRRPDGTLLPGDALSVKNVSGIGQPLAEMCPYIYETAVSPHLAARLEGSPVELDVALRGLDRVCGQYDYVAVEGSGGICCPLRFEGQEIYLEDIIKARSLPCVIVADAGLGTLNALALTAEYMKARGIVSKGIILNHYDPESLLHQDNLFMCGHMTGLSVLACVKDGDSELETGMEVLQGLFE